MIGCTRRPGKRTKVRFVDPPWNERSEEWQERDAEVPADHVARAVAEAMRQLVGFVAVVCLVHRSGHATDPS